MGIIAICLNKMDLYKPKINGMSSNISDSNNTCYMHDDVIKWKHFPRYWPFVRGIHRSPVNSQHKGQWRGALMFSLICAWMKDWVNNREAGDLRRHHTHYDVIVMGLERCIQWSVEWVIVGLGIDLSLILGQTIVELNPDLSLIRPIGTTLDITNQTYRYKIYLHFVTISITEEALVVDIHPCQRKSYPA